MKENRILLIGDEPNILRTLRRNLAGRGYDVAIALDDNEAYLMVSQTTSDLYVLILDFTTVDINGLEICERLRQKSQAPIIVLSSVGSESTKIKALDLGADDYLVLPFNMEEFLARVRSALRRWNSSQAEPKPRNEIILAGNLVIDIAAHHVIVRSEQVKLTPTEYEILLYLAQRSGKVITHRELLRAIWGAEYGDEREYLRVFISQIRRKIEENPLQPVHLLTEPGVGYRFAGGEYP
jgi:two-component system, OmpR family, KDP operon response regulator KdpE